MKNLKFIFVTGILCLAACSKDTQSDAGVDRGLCTQSTIDAYNTVIERSVLTIYNDGADAQVTTSCQQINSLLQGRSCQAQNISSGGEMTISYENVRTRCEENASKATAVPPTSEPIPAQTSGQDSYVDSDGMCTPHLSEKIHEISRRVKQVEQNRDFIDARQVSQDCRSLQDDLRDHESCHLYNAKTHSYDEVSADHDHGVVAELCDRAREAVANAHVRRH